MKGEKIGGEKKMSSPYARCLVRLDRQTWHCYISVIFDER